MDESDSNPAWQPGVPFRFMSLPSEVRVLVYKELFRGMFLSGGKRCQCLGYAKTVPGHEGHQFIPDYDGDDTSPGREHEITLARVCEPGRLPDVLTVSKSVRDEALPVFSQSITLFLHCEDDKILQRLPKDYLSRTQSAILQNGCDAHVDKALMPNLRTLHIFLGADEEAPRLKAEDYKGGVPSEKEIGSAIIQDFKDQPWEDLKGTKELLKEGNPPFRVLISYENWIIQQNPLRSRELVCTQSINEIVRMFR